MQWSGSNKRQNGKQWPEEGRLNRQTPKQKPAKKKKKVLIKYWHYLNILLSPGNKTQQYLKDQYEQMWNVNACTKITSLHSSFSIRAPEASLWWSGRSRCLYGEPRRSLEIHRSQMNWSRKAQFQVWASQSYLHQNKEGFRCVSLSNVLLREL